MAAVGGVILAGPIVILDLLREPCDRRLSRWLPHVVGLVSESVGDRLSERLWIQRFPWDVFVYRTPDPYSLGGGLRQDTWRNVQGGVQAAIPTLQISVFSRPYWEATDDQFLENLERANPSIERLGQGSGREAPRFLLFQEGGGVEGLLLQILVLPDGKANLWLIDDLRRRLETLPEPVLKSLPLELVKRLFDLARAAGLPAESRVERRCFTLDGPTQSVILSENGRVGRAEFRQGCAPPASLFDLRELLLGAMSLERSRQGYRRGRRAETVYEGLRESIETSDEITSR